MKTALAFLIIGLSSWFDFTAQDPIGSALGLQSCSEKITQEQGQSLATIFSILVFKNAQSKSLGSQSACDSKCIASFVKLVSDMKNCGTNVIAETVADCVDAEDDAKAAVFAALTGKDPQLSSQIGFNDDNLLPAALCMLNEVGSQDGIPIITFIKSIFQNSDIPFAQYLSYIPSKLISQLGITVNNVNGASEALQGLSSLESAASISNSGNLGLRGPGVVSTVGQIPNQIISSSNGITGLASSLLNIPMQLLNQILSLVGLSRNLSGTSSSQQTGLGGLGSVLSLGNQVLQNPTGILSGLASSILPVVPGINPGGNAGHSGIQAGTALNQMGLGGLGSISNLGNEALSGVSKLPTDILSVLGPNGIGSLTNQVLSLGGNAGGIASDQAAGLGNLVSILSLGNLGSSGVGKLPVIGGLANEVLSLGGKAASDQAGFGGLGSILSLGNPGLSGVLQIPAGILSGLGLSGITSLIGLGGNAGRSGNQAGITSDQTDQLGAAVNIVKGADVQPQGHGSLGSGSSISSSGTLGLNGLGLGGISLIPQQIISSSSDIISGTASGASELAKSVSGLASNALGLASGAPGLDSGVASISGRVVGLPAQVLNIGGNTGLTGTLPGITSDQKQLGITLNTGAGGLGTGSSISSTANLGQVAGGKGLLSG